MRKVFLSTILLFSTLVYGQTDLDMTIVKEVTILVNQANSAKSAEEVDEIIEKISAIVEKSNDPEVVKMGAEVLKVLGDLSDDKKMQVKTKEISSIDKSLLKGLLVKKDRFKDRTFIKPKYRGEISLYISKNDKTETMQLRYRTFYKGSNWLFHDRVIVLCDEDKYTFSVGESERDVTTSATVMEWTDNKASASEIEIFRKIAKANNVELRFSGSQGVDDKKLKKYWKKSLLKILDVYDALKE